jgi:hypothetical protein
MWNLVRRPSHGKSDGNSDLGNCPGSKSPLPKGAGGGIVQYGASSACRDGSAGDVAAGCVNIRDDHSTPCDVPRTRLVRILGTRRVQCEGFCSRHRHRPRGFDWRKFLRRVLWPRWRCSFFHKLRLNIGRRRRLWDRNIFWRGSRVRWRQYRLDDIGRLRREVYRRGFPPLRDCNCCEVDCQCNAQGRPEIPSRRRLVKERFYFFRCHTQSLGWSRNSLERFAPNFKRDLIETSRADYIQRMGNVQVNRVPIAANEHLGLRS